MQKIAFITGASSGIGKETTLLFASKGYKVYAAARHVENIKELNIPDIVPITMDVSKSKSITEALKQIQENQIDILINAAGFGIYGAIEETSIETAKEMFNTNLFGLAEVTKAFLPLLKNSQDARIINLSSLSGKFTNPFGAWYCASKYALESFSDALRLELSIFKIKVILIEPGPVNTNFDSVAFDDFMKNTPEAYLESKKKFYKNFSNSFKNGSDPKKVAKVIFKAANSKRPKIRYNIEFIHSLLLFILKFLPDWLKDFFTKLSLM